MAQEKELKTENKGPKSSYNSKCDLNRMEEEINGKFQEVNMP